MTNFKSRVAVMAGAISLLITTTARWDLFSILQNDQVRVVLWGLIEISSGELIFWGDKEGIFRILQFVPEQSLKKVIAMGFLTAFFSSLAFIGFFILSTKKFKKKKAFLRGIKAPLLVVLVSIILIINTMLCVPSLQLGMGFDILVFVGIWGIWTQRKLGKNINTVKKRSPENAIIELLNPHNNGLFKPPQQKFTQFGTIALAACLLFTSFFNNWGRLEFAFFQYGDDYYYLWGFVTRNSRLLYAEQKIVFLVNWCSFMGHIFSLLFTIISGFKNEDWKSIKKNLKISQYLMSFSLIYNAFFTFNWVEGLNFEIGPYIFIQFGSFLLIYAIRMKYFKRKYFKPKNRK